MARESSSFQIRTVPSWLPDTVVPSKVEAMHVTASWWPLRRIGVADGSIGNIRTVPRVEPAAAYLPSPRMQTHLTPPRLTWIGRSRTGSVI